MTKLEFYPNLTPRQVIEAGAFGGCYFGVDVGANLDDYKELFEYHFDGVDTRLYLGKTYKAKLNLFRVRSGMDYNYWKTMGWMHERDPYGWFEHYCKYSMGMRGEDDSRQIQRWQDFCGVNGRWRNNIYRKIHQSGNVNISPRICQSLLHWAYMVNEEDYILWCRMNSVIPKENLFSMSGGNGQG
jgi:hypothetical protein